MAKAQKKKPAMSMQAKLLLFIFAVTAFVFMKITVLLLVGMLPTIIVRFIDKSPERTKILTIGFMNFAGCFPYCVDMFAKDKTLFDVLPILMNPFTIIIMYGAAGLGRLIEWGVVGFVASMMVQKGKTRLVDIKKAQEMLVKKWGPEVTGEMPLDENGFSIELNNK